MKILTNYIGKMKNRKDLTDEENIENLQIRPKIWENSIFPRFSDVSTFSRENYWSTNINFLKISMFLLRWGDEDTQKSSSTWVERWFSFTFFFFKIVKVLLLVFKVFNRERSNLWKKYIRFFRNLLVLI